MNVYFLKELLGSGFSVNGKKVPFEPLDGNQGVVALDDTKPDQKEFIDGLTKSIGKYGIVRISQEQYTQKKTQFPFKTSKLELRQRAERLQVIGRPPQSQSQRAPVAAAAVSAPKLSAAEKLDATAAILSAAMVKPDASDPLNKQTFRPATARVKAQSA